MYHLYANNWQMSISSLDLSLELHTQLPTDYLHLDVQTMPQTELLTLLPSLLSLQLSSSQLMSTLLSQLLKQKSEESSLTLLFFFYFTSNSSADHWFYLPNISAFDHSSLSLLLAPSHSYQHLCLGYWNSLQTGLPVSPFAPWESILNIAARDPFTNLGLIRSLLIWKPRRSSSFHSE